MPAWLLGLLNPRNWLSIISALKSLAGLIDLLREQLKKRQAEKAKDKIEEASNQVNQATSFKEKMDAMCELEKATNPKSDCDK